MTDPDRPRRLLSPAFWAMIALAALSLLSAVVVTLSARAPTAHRVHPPSASTRQDAGRGEIRLLIYSRSAEILPGWR